MPHCTRSTRQVGIILQGTWSQHYIFSAFNWYFAIWTFEMVDNLLLLIFSYKTLSTVAYTRLGKMCQPKSLHTFKCKLSPDTTFPFFEKDSFVMILSAVWLSWRVHLAIKSNFNVNSRFTFTKSKVWKAKKASYLR